MNGIAHVLLQLVVLFGAFVTTTTQSAAQLLVHIQDTLYVNRVLGNATVGWDTLDASGFAPGFLFEMQSDSCHTAFNVTEIRLNGQNLYLPGWADGRQLVALDADELSMATVSQHFVVAAGDDVSCYRELQWFDPSNHQQLANNYYSLDTLDFAIELVDAPSGSRVQLLDSFGVSRRNTRGAPVFHGIGPIMRQVSYTVPSTLDGDTVFIRARIYQRGDGAHDPVRLDRITYALSSRLTHSMWANYRAAFNGSFSKRNPRELDTRADDGGVELTVTPNPTNRTARIDFDLPQANGLVQLIVYASDGRPIFVPAAGPQLVRGSVSYEFPESGTYFLVLQNAGAIVRSIPVQVVR